MPERNTLTPAERAFVERQRVARLATADAAGQPHAVPVCFAYDGQRFYTPLDEKPKRGGWQGLQRIRNIQARPEASLLVDVYDDDWSRLGYVLARGPARLLPPESDGHATALRLLRDRYPQYRTMDLESRPVIALTPERVTSWGPALAETADTTGTDAGNAWLQPGRGLDFAPLARSRRSVRAFQDRPVPREALEAMLEAARWAPSPHGRQPWRFVVLTRAEPKQRLAEAMGDEWRRVLAMDGQASDVIQKRLDISRERIRTAPALILACLYLEGLDHYPDADRQRAEETMAVQSLGAAIQNMLLAAYAIGLDTGWMCAPLFCGDTVRAALDLDPMLIPHALIPVGYAARDPKRRPHRPLDELVVRFD
ncbi:MAG: PPOX class F420-dependent oxidoreductase [Ktedonobacterales bacterium]|jgi:PPOX class probable F420-dependent enzyme|nr:MAG: PPOX class F420-dependent oxidoreductase [Ktedonobacterales bacterium]